MEKPREGLHLGIDQAPSHRARTYLPPRPTRVQFAADACPKDAIHGYVKAWSPLLDEPLEGPVYQRSSDDARFAGQNGDRRNFHPPVKPSCAKQRHRQGR